MANVFNHLQCPHCHAEWSMEEVEDQVCDACGWPDVNENNYPETEPDLNAPNAQELAERMHGYQQNLK
jgi:hypothetical protein